MSVNHLIFDMLSRYFFSFILRMGIFALLLNNVPPMGWNIDDIDFDNIVIHGNNVVIYAEKNHHITLWVEKEIRKAAWHGDAVLVHLKCGETRRYLNHMHYVTLQQTSFQKAYQFLATQAAAIMHRFPKFSREKTRGKYTMPSSTNIPG